MYKHRIFIPITFEWGVVSFQTLSPYRESNIPYLACEEEKEIIPHKHIVYGFDYAVEKRRCVLVEGVTDVWRLGPGAVATFGKKWTQEQINFICNNFDKVTVMMDADVPKHESKKLAQAISAHGVWSVDIITLAEGDPAKLTPRRAREIMGILGF
jgi:DNA primase